MDFKKAISVGSNGQGSSVFTDGAESIWGKYAMLAATALGLAIEPQRLSAFGKSAGKFLLARLFRSTILFLNCLSFWNFNSRAKLK